MIDRAKCVEAASHFMVGGARGWVGRTIAAAALVFCGNWNAHAEGEGNWPAWRGPLYTGAAPDANPPITWSETEGVKWKVAIPGNGTSSPIVWEDKVFVLTAISAGATAPQASAKKEEPPAKPAGGQEKKAFGKRGGGFRSAPPTQSQRFVVLCLDRKTGKPVWEKTAREELPHEGHHQDHGFASHSPVTDGEHLYAYFGSRGIFCYDLDGNLKWEKRLGKMQVKNSFGEGSSPALFGDTVVINWDHEGDDFIVALDKKTGDEKWRQPRNEDTTWATPLVVPHGDGSQVITVATGKVRSYDLGTGKELWQAPGLTANVIPTPVFADGVVFATSGFRGNALYAIKLGHTGDLSNTEAIAWKHDRNTPYVPSPLLYGERLYFFSGNSNVLSSFDIKTGKPMISVQRLNGLQGVYASPVGAADRIYLVGRNGVTVVAKHADTFEQLASNKLDDGIDASPAIAGNELFLRGRKSLYCLSEK